MRIRRAQVSHLCVMTACTAGSPNALVLSVLRCHHTDAVSRKQAAVWRWHASERWEGDTSRCKSTVSGCRQLECQFAVGRHYQVPIHRGAWLMLSCCLHCGGLVFRLQQP